MEKKILAIDLDDVIIDTLQSMLNIYNKRYRTNIKKEDITKWEISRGMFECFKDIEYSGIIEKNNACKILEELSHTFKIVIVTSSDFDTIKNKSRWVLDNMKFLSEKDIIVTSQKELIHADYFIDDAEHNLKNIIANSRSKPICFMYDMPHNAKAVGYRRIYDLNDFVSYIKGV